MKAGHEEEYADETSAVPWPQSDGVRPKISPALDDRRSEDGEARGGEKSNNIMKCSNATFTLKAATHTSELV